MLCAFNVALEVGFTVRIVCLFACVFACVYEAVAQLTDKIDPMYIIPKDRPGPHDDAHLIYFLGVTKFGHHGAKKLFFLL